ncbi:cytochrome P450 4g15-like [Trichoplusia ni]|uniref:Cytochrome P450 4g15-like n=1 Tax=Trichoplusia ni TaxID=7111 RepID=A0A7E5VME7_TRINI|nr:cytochrome P450 4g15-like [Trichoplusia ni]
MMELLLLVILSCVLLVWLWMRYRHPLPPICPGALPVIGHVLAVPREPQERKVYYRSVINTGFIIYFPVLSDPDDAILVANTCFSKSYMQNFASELYGRGLATSEVSMWKVHRKLLNPSFSQQILNSFLGVFNDQSRRLVSELDMEVGKDTLDVETYLTTFLLRTSCRKYFNLKSPPIGRRLNDFFHFEFQIIQRKLNDKESTVIENSQDKFQPLLDRMLHLYKTQDAFTVDEIKEHVNTMIAATYETTAISITFALILLGSHPDVQSRVLQELNEVFKEKDRDVDKTDLHKLVYFDAVIKESLRLYPPGPRIVRCIDTDVKLKEYTLKAGSEVLISIHSINRHPMWGADADLFRPERWLDPASLPGNPNAFATFSLGKRNCIGKTYAILVMKVTLVHLLRKYHFTSSSPNIQSQCGAFFQVPKNEHEVKIQYRK